jgi:hypothetical protein
MLKLLTRGILLAHLKEAISNTGESIFIVGPWLDAYFTRIIVNSITNNDVEVKFIVRVDDGVIDTKTLSALNLAGQNLNNFKAKSLENLHSKVILIDNRIFFLGSANWYWYSLNLGVEVTINGTTDQLPELIIELEKYWDEGIPIPDDLISKFQDFEPVIDLRC